MSSTDTAYSVRWELPDLIEQGKLNTLKARVYRAGALVAPSAATVSVFDASNTALVNAAPATSLAGSVASYDLPAATVASSSRGEGWRVEWSLTMPDGVVHIARNDAALVKGRLYSPITEADLYRVVSSLNPGGTKPIHSASDFADKIDEALIQLEQRMLERGNRPNLVLSPSAMRETLLYLTLALIFEDFATRLNLAYEERAKAYREQFCDAYARMRVVYDATDSGAPADGAGKRKGSSPTLWLNGRGD